MALSKRLQSILSMIEPCHRLLDIGSDHALLCIEAIKQNKAKYAIAADNKPGPISKAIKNIETHQLLDKVTPVLSDGATNIEQQADCIVVAGLGAETIINIIEQSPDNFKQANQLIFSPHSKVELLRKYLYNNGYKIIKEQLVYDDKYYVMICAIYTDDNLPYTLDDLYLGQLKKDVLYPEWIEHLTRYYKSLTIKNNEYNSIYQLFNQEYDRIQSVEMDED